MVTKGNKFKKCIDKYAICGIIYPVENNSERRSNRDAYTFYRIQLV